ncbi:hypothetical protein [Hansschlegelia zhihuaiae]|uniref:Uncharacterized protein n=1 Tax=Hansschlegelia zhihuaiae TaxID=405005 RepID=A0A4Q0MF39_9HYPH|nr:hypothetical protein [Hansschlegelia zhihuaiae]RXF72078.1 hypothetical protein EK403_14805 [Hansschlegelia zhihuaiae]
MTCIVGLRHAGRVIIGGDRAGVDTGNYSLTVREDRKVFVNGPFAMGFTTSFRMGQVLAYGFTPPARRPETDVMRFMVTEFVDAVRAAFKAAGYALKEKEQEAGGSFLVGYEGRLFHIADDYQVGESSHGFDACGSGAQVALGSLLTSDGGAARNRIERALKAAETFNAGVRAPFDFVEV